MRPQERRQIQEFAYKVIGALKLTVPIDVESAVFKLGGEFKEVDSQELGGAEAMIVKNAKDKVGPEFSILIDKDKVSQRKRFSLAHELGHLFLHMGYLINPDKWDKSESFQDSVRFRAGYDEEEFQAHEFAASILMPENEFIAESRRHLTNGNYNVAKIAEFFNVSLDAALTRGRWIGLFSWNQ